MNALKAYGMEVSFSVQNEDRKPKVQTNVNLCLKIKEIVSGIFTAIKSLFQESKPLSSKVSVKPPASQVKKLDIDQKIKNLEKLIKEEKLDPAPYKKNIINLLKEEIKDGLKAKIEKLEKEKNVIFPEVNTLVINDLKEELEKLGG